MPHISPRPVPRFDLRGFRPAIVEAKLMTEKHAQDAVYVATLAEELHNIAEKLSVMEQTLQPEETRSAARERPCRVPEAGADATWIRETSRDLDVRMRRLNNSLRASTR
jgi:hypothetical protein